MNTDGSNQKRLTTSPASDSGPAWSPDGGRIAFVSNRDGNAEIYVMNADGSNPVNVSNNPASDTEPTWSPDGKKIAFQTNRASNMEIYVMDADGSNQVNLSNAAGNDTVPAWSPDGSKIAFRTSRDGVDRDIYVMDADGKNQVNITSNDAEDFMPSWGAANSAPVLSDVAVSGPVNEGGTATLTGKIKDENEGDSFTLGVDWGEGNGVQYFELPAGATSFELTHPYADDNPSGTASDEYTIHVSVNDHRFGTDTEHASVSVNNADPVLSNFVLKSSPVVLGSQVTLRGDVLDPGQVSMATEEGLKVSIALGDGASSNFTLLSPGGVIGAHQYTALGSYTITVKATDNDLGESVQTFDVLVSPPPQPAAPTGFRVDYIAADRIQLVWADASNNEDGFAVERCSSRGCNNFIEVGRVGANSVGFLDKPLFSNTQYYYRVRAFNAGGASAYTDVVSAKTLRK